MKFLQLEINNKLVVENHGKSALKTDIGKVSNNNHVVTSSIHLKYINYCSSSALECYDFMYRILQHDILSQSVYFTLLSQRHPPKNLVISILRSI